MTMKLRAIATGMLAAGLFAASGAQAQDLTAADKADAECALALVQLEAQVPDEMKGAIQAGTLYFTGKLAGRGGIATLRERMAKAEAGFDISTMQATAQRCGKELEDVGKMLTAA